MKNILLLLFSFIVFAHVSVAQHEQHTMNMKAKKDTVPEMKMDHAQHMQMKMPVMDHSMSHAYSRNLSMSRNASGTAWLPDESPMYMYMTGKKAMWMLHGNIFLRYTNTDIFNKGNRGADKLDAPNWFMVMLNKPVGKKGLFSAKAMLSLDRLTEGGNGYPLLFQSGETYKRNRLVNRQHPHDLFSELSIGYSYAINKQTDVFAYIGYPGEPALSAPAFMHRVSSMNNPDAPLGHHWQDATHITFGVSTLGFRYKQFKLEGSVFTGREPDEERYGFDKVRFDSYSYRLSYNPSKNWALQFSQGFIHSPEALEPATDITRTTTSALYAKKIGAGRHFNAAAIWGMNNSGADHVEHSVLLEENYRFSKNAIYSRYEFVQKSTEELALDNFPEHRSFNVHVLSAGYNRSLWKKGWLELTAGSQCSLNFPATALQPLYGKLPVGFQVYLQLRPSLNAMN